MRGSFSSSVPTIDTAMKNLSSAMQRNVIDGGPSPAAEPVSAPQRVPMYDAITAIVLSLAAIVGTTIFHFEALAVIGRYSRLPHHPHVAVPTVLTAVILAHIIEIAAYTGIYILADGPLDIGSFAGQQPGIPGMFYFAAETYSSLGAGDVIPHGALRLIASIGSINGILLLAWSGAYLFAFANRLQDRDRD
jgi:hypothetical protein